MSDEAQVLDLGAEELFAKPHEMEVSHSGLLFVREDLLLISKFGKVGGGSDDAAAVAKATADAA